MFINAAVLVKNGIAPNYAWQVYYAIHTVFDRTYIVECSKNMLNTNNNNYKIIMTINNNNNNVTNKADNNNNNDDNIIIIYDDNQWRIRGGG